ncbi:restriction endonuclease subunit S [Streptococcus ruminantium]|uniref:restriction endonuclease subunit S n=1 Tax=Streptococcus ruminantium TaxID=1917441 RepID=UPI001F188AD6|nr:restriction endonuclease subunit S [Streptococcus ruminantium]
MKREMMNNRRWKIFKINQVFNLFTGASISQDKFDNGEIPRITATDVNNGIGLFTNRMNSKNYRLFKNFISVSFLGSIFYHSYEASLDMKIHGLQIKDREFSPNLAKFIITCLKNSLSTASYGNQLSSKDLLTKSILLPVKNDGTPDWTFMEEYVQIKSNQIKNTYQYPKKHKIRDFRGLDEVEWSEYFIDDIIVVSSGVRLTKDNQIEGKLPFIGASDRNNGITAYIENKNSSTESNVLGVNYNGSVGFASYHPYKATFSDDVKRLKFKNGKNNRYTLLFLKHVIERQANKYAYGYKFNGQRMKRQIIKLPSLSGNLDFEFMEQYMKRLENKMIDTIKMK